MLLMYSIRGWCNHPIDILPRFHFVKTVGFWGQTGIAGVARLTSPNPTVDAPTVFIFGSDIMAYRRLQGIYPGALDGDRQFWL